MFSRITTQKSGKKSILQNASFFFNALLFGFADFSEGSDIDLNGSANTRRFEVWNQPVHRGIFQFRLLFESCSLTVSTYLYTESTHAATILLNVPFLF
ncbi:hypothetical protein ASG33_16855 [Dyadobacter sp. Leaf189]|nr:hypothetical protein ASG33_16855 [Dyadobacter sp. Leaf189]